MQRPTLQQLRELPWLQGKDDLFIGMADCMVLVGEETFPAHTAVMRLVPSSRRRSTPPQHAVLFVNKLPQPACRSWGSMCRSWAT